MASFKIQASLFAKPWFSRSSARLLTVDIFGRRIKIRCLSSGLKGFNEWSTKACKHVSNHPHHCRLFSVGSQFAVKQRNDWTWKETKFGGVMISLRWILNDQNKDNFANDLSEYLEQWKSAGKRGVWAKVQLEHSWTIPNFYSAGFTCHHAKDGYIMMTKWLPDHEENKIPNFAFHTVGVSGIAVNEEKGEALVVQDKGKIQKWKFPGGFAEAGEYIGDTAVREMREETGIEAEFQSLLTFRQQHGVAFNLSDLYFICRLRPLTFDIKMCETEIAKCEWLPLDYLLHSKDSTPFTKRVTALVLNGMKSGFSNVDIVEEKMTSWIPPYDRTFKIFHRPIDVEEL